MDRQDRRIVMSDTSVPKTVQRSITEFTKKPIWQYGWQSNARRDRHCYWHAHFAGGDGNSRRNCLAELQANTAAQPILDLWNVLSQGILKGHEPLRAYANSHTFGVEGYVHTDNEDTENYFSTIYYAHPVWHANWCGETVFYNKDSTDIVASIYPKPGRLISFHGATPHCARAPSRDCAELRIVVVFKTQLSADAKPLPVANTPEATVQALATP
jgi:SM-20-related protein